MTPTQLRQALERRSEALVVFPDDRILFDAARSWLILQEADETMVEKVVRAIERESGVIVDDSEARAVLAAIVGEET